MSRTPVRPLVLPAIVIGLLCLTAAPAAAADGAFDLGARFNPLVGVDDYLVTGGHVGLTFRF